MERDFQEIITNFKIVEKELKELESASELLPYTLQIVAKETHLNSMKLIVNQIKENSIELKLLVGELSKILSKFMYSYSKRGLSFFYPIPSDETEISFFDQPIKIIEKIHQYGLKKGKIPIPDDNPVYEAFGISHHFPEMVEDFRNCLLLIYRNIILKDIFYPLVKISESPILLKPINKNTDEKELYNIEELFKNIFVIESESNLKQGTAFYLKEFGIITCDHCIRSDETGQILTDLFIYNGNDISNKIAVQVINSNKDLDFAILEFPMDFKVFGLEKGSSSDVKQLQKIGVAGFPNYNYGDNGIFFPGYITGFRNYAGKKHMLVSSSLISGMSGSPTFDETSKVIGIAVTGADKMSTALQTEKHAIIPIELIEKK